VNESQQHEGASPDDAPQKPAPQDAGARPPMWRRWGWAILVAALALVGVLLAVADTAIYGAKFGPYATFVIGPAATEITVAPRSTPNPEKFTRTHLPDRINVGGPFGNIGPISPLRALRAFLSNGAGLVLLALGVLLLLPNRARVAVERLEARHGTEIALAAGFATVLLGVGAVALLRFTLIFLAVIPAVFVIALGAALFGLACIGLAIGRLLQRRLRMGPAHPLVAAVAGALVVFDLAVIPYLGAIALAAVAIAGLGLAVVTRFGSESGWSFADLDW
jgi:hypothetical protein